MEQLTEALKKLAEQLEIHNRLLAEQITAHKAGMQQASGVESTLNALLARVGLQS